MADGLQLPLEHLTMPIAMGGEQYWRHPLGGGLVADSSYVPDAFVLDYNRTVAMQTRAIHERVNNVNFAVIQGPVSGMYPISRWMDDEGVELRREQREMGVISRLLRIEQQLARVAETSSRLF